ncbi:MAG TPA: hypothetical protein PLB55_19540 [Prosthecobacter sp.]|nr:hypothetical protein [Prosthecobacter sp.]
MKGASFRLERKSRIRAFDLTNIIEIKDNQLHETTTVHTDEAIALKLVYHFMHAWTPSVSAYLTADDSGALRDDAEVAKKFYINKRVDWIAVYEPKSGQFGVARLLQAPEQGGHIAMIWNVPGTYRKFYLKCFDNATVPAGFTGTWRMVTAFGGSTQDTWETSARKLAGELRP